MSLSRTQPARPALVLASSSFFAICAVHSTFAQAGAFCDVTSTHLPFGVLNGLSMDAGQADLDADGDIDLIIANEFGPNILLLNDGSGHFDEVSRRRIPQVDHDSEDIAIADFDGDGDPDIVVVSEDDLIDEFYINDGFGAFGGAGNRLPVRARSWFWLDLPFVIIDVLPVG